MTLESRHPVTVKGNVGRNPELRMTPKGKAVCSFNLATKAGQDEDGNDLTIWVRVTTWGHLAEAVNRAAAKGDFLYCEGVFEKPWIYEMKDVDGKVLVDPDTKKPLLDAKPQLKAWFVTGLEWAQKPLEEVRLPILP